MKLLLISVVSLTGCAATLPLETSEAHFKRHNAACSGTILWRSLPAA